MKHDPRDFQRNTTGLLKPKSTWQLGKTQTIRIPIALAPRLLQIARDIDNGCYSSLEDKLTTIIAKVNTKEKGYTSNSATKLIADIKALIS